MGIHRADLLQCLKMGISCEDLLKVLEGRWVQCEDIDEKGIMSSEDRGSEKGGNDI